jgi:hypothetical protein
MKRLLFLALPLVLATALSARASVNPSPDLLAHGIFRVQGMLGYQDKSWPYTTHFTLGLFNSLEVGVGYADGFSLSAKAWLRDQDGLIPAIAVGGRNIVTNTEAVFYGVPSGEGRDSLENEVYGSLGWKWSSFTLYGGASIFPRADDNIFEPFWTASTAMPYGFAATYEGFLRRGDVMSNFELSWEFDELIRLAIGTTNPWGGGKDYQEKMFYAELTLIGRLINTVWPNMRSELDSARIKLEAQDKKIAEMEQKFASLDAIYAEMWTDYGDTLRVRNARREAEFDSIAALYTSDTWDLELLHEKEAAFLAQGNKAGAILEKIAFDRLEADSLRINAVRVMGNSKNPKFVAPLAQILGADGPDLLLREAVLALASIGTEEAKAAIAGAQLRLQGAARATADQVLGSF